MSTGQKRDETPRWRFAIIVWIAIFPMITLTQYLLDPLIKDWAIWQKTLLLTLIEIPYAVFFALPILQGVFKGFLKNRKWENSDRD